MGELRFEPAAMTDVDGILALLRAYYQEDGYAPEGAARALVQLLAAPELGQVWVVRDRSEIAAYCVVTLGFSLEYGGRDAFLDEIHVAPGARGQGLGTQALDLAVRYCTQQGVHALHLEVERHRPRAQQLYQRHGFVAGSRTLMTRRLDGQGNPEP